MAAHDHAPESQNLPPRLGRYRVEQEIARGGMGRVVRVFDEDFRRPLAMKVLLDRARGQAGLEERFLREARLTGQLQHPGVPPVQELGRLPDGLPYFIMKLIQGDSLSTLLGRRTSPDQDLPRFLSIFEQICQTLAYAHGRGVIHRDLKPANIMVGAFGEVQVMDWGLAKELQDPNSGDSARSSSPRDETPTPSAAGGQPPGSAADPNNKAPTRTADWEDNTPQDQTEAGQVLGTPAYMAPEQACGEIDRLDARCDVFGLGAILCEILTGRPPFAAHNVGASFRMAQSGDLAGAFARLGGCGADAELIRLAKECLAVAPWERPPEAGPVAAAIARYQADLQQRLKQAEIEQAAATGQVR
jgi:serine/threonine-protein kinase